MSTTIDTAFIRQFRDAVVMLAEQQTSRVKSAVNVIPVMGEMWDVERLGSINASEITTRFEQIGRGDIAHTRRWGVVRGYDVRPLFLDSIDKVKMLVRFESRYLRRLASAMARAVDDTIIAALDGPVTEGKTAGSTANFPSGTAGQDVFSFSTGSTPGPLNLDTLLRAKAKLLGAEATESPNNPVTVLINSNAWLSLCQDNKFINLDFTRGAATLDTGELPPRLGMRFIRTERLPDISDSNYDNGTPANRVFMFTRDAIDFGEAASIQADITQRKDLRGYPWQVYTWGAWGAVRVEDVQVVRILAKKTT